MLSVKERKKRERKKFLLIGVGVLWAASLIILVVRNEFDHRLYSRPVEREVTIGPQFETPVTEKEEMLRMVESNEARFLELQEDESVLETEPVYNGIFLDDNIEE